MERGYTPCESTYTKSINDPEQTLCWQYEEEPHECKRAVLSGMKKSLCIKRMRRTNIIPISIVQWKEPAEQSQHWATQNKHKAKHNSEDSLCCIKLWVWLLISKCNNASEGQDEVDHQHYKVVYTQRKEKGIRCLHV